MNEWELEGWASAQWFTDAAASCGADLTRTCIEKYMTRPTSYDGHGLLIPRNSWSSTRTDDPQLPERRPLAGLGQWWSRRLGDSGQGHEYRVLHGAEHLVQPLVTTGAGIRTVTS